MDIYNKEFWQAIDIPVAESELVIDRPKDSHHPRYPEVVYQVDYGYLKGSSSMDGGGIDVWKGPMENPAVDAVICIVDRFLNESEYMKGILIERKDWV